MRIRSLAPCTWETAAVLAAAANPAWRKRRRAHTLLAGRQQLSSEAFGQQYFRDEEQAQFAAATREALAEHLGRRLDGLRPDDLLWDDLHIDLEADPQFFWLLEEKMDIDLIGEDAGRFVKLQRSVNTFRDLVEAVLQASAGPKGFAHS